MIDGPEPLAQNAKHGEPEESKTQHHGHASVSVWRRVIQRNRPLLLLGRRVRKKEIKRTHAAYSLLNDRRVVTVKAKLILAAPLQNQAAESPSGSFSRIRLDSGFPECHINQGFGHRLAK